MKKIQLLVDAYDTYAEEYNEMDNIHNYYWVVDNNPEHTEEDLRKILDMASKYASSCLDDYDLDDPEDVKRGIEEFDEHFYDIMKYASLGVSGLELFRQYLDIYEIEYHKCDLKPDYTFKW